MFSVVSLCLLTGWVTCGHYKNKRPYKKNKFYKLHPSNNKDTWKTLTPPTLPPPPTTTPAPVHHTSIGKPAVGLRPIGYLVDLDVFLHLLYDFIFLQAKKLSSSDSSQDGYVTDEDEGAGQEKLKKNNKKEGATKKHKLAKELSDLVNYCKSTRFEDFATSQQTRESAIAAVVVSVNAAANVKRLIITGRNQVTRSYGSGPGGSPIFRGGVKGDSPNFFSGGGFFLISAFFGDTPLPGTRHRNMVNVRPARILLECILVLTSNTRMNCTLKGYNKLVLDCPCK